MSVPCNKQKRLRLPYTKKEDIKIIEYIVKNNVYAKVKGTKIWKNLSKEDWSQTYQRTWHSLKERFRRSIIPDLETYDLDPGTLSKLLAPFRPEERIKPERVKIQRCGPYGYYSTAEDIEIIKFVIKHHGEVRGNVMWHKLEDMKILPGRPWSSMRNRFLKYIVNNLNQLVDKSTADAVRRIYNDDLSFVDYDDSEEDTYKKIKQEWSDPKPKKQVFHRRFNTSVRKPAVQKSPEPVPSTSKMCFRSSGSDTDGLSKSRKRNSTESLSSEEEVERRRRRRRRRTSDHTRLVDSDKEGETSRSVPFRTRKGTRVPSAVSTPCTPDGTVYKIPRVVLERCQTQKWPTSSDSDAQSDSRIFDATTLELTDTECICCECDAITNSEETDLKGLSPCGKGCMRLKIGPAVPFCVTTAAAVFRLEKDSTTSTKKSAKDGSPTRRNEIDTLAEDVWLSKATTTTNRRASTSASGSSMAQINQHNGGTKVKVEPEQETDNMIIFMDSETDLSRLSSDSEEDDCDRFVDPIYEHLLDNIERCHVEMDGCKISLGPTSFPVIHPDR